MHRDIIFWSGMYPVKRFGVLSHSHDGTRPIGAYQLAWWLRQHRISAQVIEFIQLMTVDELVEMTLPFITDKTIAIGISRTFLGFNGEMPQNVLRALWRLKVKFPQLRVISGGQVAGNLSSFPFNHHFSGHAEDELLKWVQKRKYKLEFPTVDFQIKELKHRFIPDDVILQGEALPIELGRGCIFKCKFCGYSLIGKEKGSYLRHYEHLVDEMKYNKEHFGTTSTWSMR